MQMEFEVVEEIIYGLESGILFGYYYYILTKPFFFFAYIFSVFSFDLTSSLSFGFRMKGLAIKYHKSMLNCNCCPWNSDFAQLLENMKGPPLPPKK